MAGIRASTTGGNSTKHTDVQMVLFDCQENLSVPHVSKPEDSVPAWNADKEYEMIADAHLQEDNAVVVFHSFSTKSIRVIKGLCESYPSFKLKKRYMGLNRMHLTSALPKTPTVIFFTQWCILLILCLRH